ncbi:hypothetical protein HERIO_1912 [Hepatospora eriocheir]|uniref:Uncharacterized protein n=1 Tax=Hepatospora eriocheir TaxID=1081669 RepID=A0A1X0Q8M9_9MICR|nr:hypothetical protein HERIO_1912 [Hepatospora eriocheir]
MKKFKKYLFAGLFAIILLLITLNIFYNSEMFNRKPFKPEQTPLNLVNYNFKNYVKPTESINPVRFIITYLTLPIDNNIVDKLKKTLTLDKDTHSKLLNNIKDYTVEEVYELITSGEFIDNPIVEKLMRVVVRNRGNQSRCYKLANFTKHFLKVILDYIY